MKLWRWVHLKWFLLTVATLLVLASLPQYTHLHTHHLQEKEVTEKVPTVGAPARGKPSYLFVIFTTFTEDPARRPLHLAVLKNWALLGPTVKPVLFTQTPSSSLNAIASEEGWEVRPVPRKNVYGTPFIRDMYIEVYKNFQSMYYGYSNGDILFSHSLLYTLMAVHTYFDVQKYKLDPNSTFIIGTRSDYALTEDSPSWIYHPERVEQLAKKQPLYIGGVDYFITTRWGYPWYEVLDLVIGRAGIDNYLLGEAVRRKMNMVDVTETMPVLHLQGKNGTLTHLSVYHPDAKFNRVLFGHQTYDYTQCQAANARFETYESNNYIGLRPRTIKRTIQLMPPQLLQRFLRDHVPYNVKQELDISDDQQDLAGSANTGIQAKEESQPVDNPSEGPQKKPQSEASKPLNIVKSSSDNTQPESPPDIKLSNTQVQVSETLKSGSETKPIQQTHLQANLPPKTSITGGSPQSPKDINQPSISHKQAAVDEKPKFRRKIVQVIVRGSNRTFYKIKEVPIK